MEFLSMIVAALTLWFSAAFVSSSNLMMVLNIVVLVFFIFSMIINVFRKYEKISNE
ncbi:hypothetical protein FD36_GL000745 [Fructilactobacillus sanfranciscensis DSM 20451]|nr:hypothetical protein FD36_GL000745 [Fructilactobacillus sanfranciscensis DSM 20451]